MPFPSVPGIRNDTLQSISNEHRRTIPDALADVRLEGIWKESMRSCLRQRGEWSEQISLHDPPMSFFFFS